MLTFYRILTVFINAQLLILLAVLVYELLVKSYIDKVETGVISALLVYYIFTTSYFIWNTRKMKAKRVNYSVLDSDTIKTQPLQPFRFVWVIGILNGLIGVVLIIFSLVVLIVVIVFSKNSFSINDELIRILILLTIMVYGTMKIYYVERVLRQLKVIKKV